MIPGFVTTYKDKEEKIHLFFYPGTSDDGQPIYHELDLSKMKLSYQEKQNEDKSREFVFDRTDIVKIKCKLIRNDGNIDYEELVI